MVEIWHYCSICFRSYEFVHCKALAGGVYFALGVIYRARLLNTGMDDQCRPFGSIFSLYEFK